MSVLNISMYLDVTPQLTLSSLYNKMPNTEGLINNRNLCHRALEAVKSKIKALEVDTAFWFTDATFFLSSCGVVGRAAVWVSSAL